MSRERRSFGSSCQGFVLFCSDLLAITTTALLIQLAAPHSNIQLAFGTKACILTIWSSALAFAWLQQIASTLPVANDANKHRASLATAWIIAAASTFLLQRMIGLEDVNWLAQLLFSVLGLVLLLLSRRVVSEIADSPMLTDRAAERNVLQCYIGGAAIEAGQLTHQNPAINTVDSLGTQIAQAARSDNVDEIRIISDLSALDQIAGLFERLRSLPIPVLFVPRDEISWMLGSRAPGPQLSFEVNPAPFTTTGRLLKRCFDLFVVMVMLPALTPLLLCIAIAIKLDDGGPVLFRQRRRGLNGRPFRILKFRTMMVMEDGDSISQANRNDPRTTRIGRFLRRTSLDELPQLINVLCGEMSLVGPRPHAVTHDDAFEKQIAEYPLRQQVNPGITGWAQVQGFRGETSTIAQLRQRIDCDLWYVKHWTPLLDLKILVLTIFVLVHRNAF
jgi:exopolysaccharide biosynthesis polyprenyl glycosylphosphotransferase